MLRLPAAVVDISESMEAYFKTILHCCKSTGRLCCTVQKKDYVSKNQKQGYRKYFKMNDIPFGKAKKMKDFPCPLDNFLCKP